MRGITSTLAAIIFALSCATAQTRDRRGTFEVHCEKAHPLGTIKEQMKRIGIKKKVLAQHDPDLAFEPTRERLFVHAPEREADDDKPWGLLVWISPGPQGNCGVDWPAVLKKHRLIHVGPHNSGNDRFVWYRMALALDAVQWATDHYDIDPERIFVFGHSGGGRVASTLGFHWPDVFRGGLYCCGANYFRTLKHQDGQTGWRAKFRRPSGKLFAKTKRESRHVFVNGDTDINLAQSRAIQKDLEKRQRFVHTHMVVMEGLGHVTPTPRWLDHCLALLDGQKRESEEKNADGKSR